MKMTVLFKHLNHGQGLQKNIKSKTVRLNKYLDGRTEARWTCSHDEEGYFAEIKLSGPTFCYNASCHADSIYKAINSSLKKIEVQLRKQKEKWKEKLHQGVGHDDLSKRLHLDKNNTNEEDEAHYYERLG